MSKFSSRKPNKRNSLSELISIGLPTYNKALYLRKALDSLLSQTYTNFEIIISNNSSTDKTDRICREYVRKDKRIRYFRQKNNIGAVNNFNFVLEKAKSNYFMWAGDDDFWDKDFLKKLYQQLIVNKDSILAVCKYNNVYGDNYYFRPYQEFNYCRTKFNSLLHFISTGDVSYIYGLFITNLLRKIGGYHRDFRPFFHGSDYLTIMKVLLQGKMVFTRETLFYKRDTGYHFVRFNVLKYLSLNKKILFVILRYSLSPLFYIYDLIYSIKYTYFSDFSLHQKIVVVYYIILSFIKNNLKFIYSVVLGLFYLLVGIFRRIFKNE